MNLLRNGSAYFRLFTAKRKLTNQNEPSIFLLRYDFVVFKEAGRLPALNAIILPH